MVTRRNSALLNACDTFVLIFLQSRFFKVLSFRRQHLMGLGQTRSLR